MLTELDPFVLVVLGAAVAAALGVFALSAMLGNPERKAFSNRLARVSGTGVHAMKTEAEVRSIRTHKSDSNFRALDYLIKHYLPRPAVLRERLARTGLSISVGQYLMTSVGIALAVGLVAAQFLGQLVIVCMFAGVSAGLMLPHFAVNFLIARRLKAFTTDFTQAIDLIVRGLKSGLPVPASIQTVASEIKDPVGTEFGIISDRLRIGQTLEEALQHAATRIPTPEFNFFVTSLGVQRETGGNLAETLENLSNVLRERRQMKQKIKAMSSEAKASALILGSLPFVMFGIMLTINPGYVLQLFDDPRGMMMVAFGFGCLGVGMVVMAKMVRFEI